MSRFNSRRDLILVRLAEIPLGGGWWFCCSFLQQNTVWSLKMVSDEFPVLQAKKMPMMFFPAVLLAVAIMLYYWLYMCVRLFWDTERMFAGCFGATYSFFPLFCEVRVYT